MDFDQQPPVDTTQTLRIRFVRYLFGDATADDRAAVEQRISEKPEFGRDVRAFRTWWRDPNESTAGDFGAESDAAVSRQGWSVVAEKAGIREHAAQLAGGGANHLGKHALQTARRKERGFSGQTLQGRMWVATAVLAVGVIISVAGWSAAVRHLRRRTPQSYSTYTTGNSQRATITLPDGVTVALNVASRLEVPMDYMAGNRTVRLSGEGLFTVSQSDRAPFTVFAGASTARVLGTSFVIRHYAADTTVFVAVSEGKVAVGATVVTANQLAEVGRMGVPRVRSSDASPFTFATGILTIDGLPLSAAIVELDRWYDVDIRLAGNSLANRPLKGRFAAGSLRDLAEILELTFDVRVVRDGRVLTLFPK